MSHKRVLFIGGSLNQTQIVHAVAKELQGEVDCFFTPFYCDGGLLKQLQQAGWLDFSILGGRFRSATEEYLRKNDLPIDPGGSRHDYDLVVTTTDLVIQGNIRHRPIVLVQEGMTDPENWMYHLVKHLRLPRYLASTSTTGLSDAYQVFCVASHGYRDFFVRKGVRPEKIAVTGIPNFDHCAALHHNDFPYRGYVLVATADTNTIKPHKIGVAAGLKGDIIMIKEMLDYSGLSTYVKQFPTFARKPALETGPPRRRIARPGKYHRQAG